mmetsp:Transcript_93282/g.301740  ORF Transcript_93282/g.301740 Transcript_93282/m.301740 type:complete len:564 (-) Transcript_93282:143-1834(-)
MAMLSQLWGEVQGSQAPVAGKSNSRLGHASAGQERMVSLGAEVYPAGSDPLASNLPSGLRSTKAAEKVRAIADERVVNCWQKIDMEFQTQKLVWGSLLMTTARHKETAITQLSTKLEHLLLVQKSGGDIPQALALIDDLLETVAGGNTMLGLATGNAAKDVIKQHGLVEKRHQLAERLATASIPATLPQTAADKRELEAVLVACELGDDKLERRIRQVLLLPIAEKPSQPKAKDPADRGEANGKEFFTPVYVTGSKKLSDLVGTATPARSTASGMGVYYTASNASSASRLSAVAGEGAAVQPRPSSSLRGGSLGAVSRPSASNCSTASGLMDAGSAAAAMQDYAVKMVAGSWLRLNDEFSVQQLVWSSVILTKVKADARTAFHTQTEQTKAKVLEVLHTKDVDVDRALTSLAMVVPAESVQNMDTLSTPMVAAMNNVLRQHRLQAQRQELADRLATAHVPATLPRGAQQKRAFEEFIVACDVEEVNLARAVRQAFLLPIPAELGPPVAAKTLSFKSVSGKRSSSIGAVTKTSNKPSAPSAPPVTRPFTPPERGTPAALLKESI